jgi:hypothetical protein
MSNLLIKQANRLRILNAELARYNPASLIKQAADYPTTRNKQACAYYLGLKKQASIEKKAILKLLGNLLYGAGGLGWAGLKGLGYGISKGSRVAGRTAVDFTRANPAAGIIGGGALGLGIKDVGLPFAGDVIEAAKKRYNETDSGIAGIMNKFRRGIDAFSADSSSDYSSPGTSKNDAGGLNNVNPRLRPGLQPYVRQKPPVIMEINPDSIPPNTPYSTPSQNPSYTPNFPPLNPYYPNPNYPLYNPGTRGRSIVSG